jgi:DNA-binding transcriptional LysR family regulator
MAKAPPAGQRKRREYQRVRRYLRGGPPIESFRLFTDVAKHIRTGRVRTLRALSRKMGFSPSHLGKWLSEFASQIGFQETGLIELPSPGQPFVLLTNAARRMLPDFQNLLRDYETVVTQAGDMAEQIACGTWQWLMGHVFHKAAARFAGDQAARGERTGLRLYEYSSDAMMEDLAQGVIDLGFGAPEDELRGLYADSLEVFETPIVATSELVAIAPKGHRWAGTVADGAVQFSELVRETLCVIGYDRERQFARFRALGAGAGRLIVVENYASVLGLVSEAAGRTPPARVVGIVPRFGVQAVGGAARNPALDVFEVAGMWNPANRFAFWVRKSWTPHPEFEKFIACVVEVVNEVWRGGGPTTGRPAAAGGKRGRRRAE